MDTQEQQDCLTRCKEWCLRTHETNKPLAEEGVKELYALQGRPVATMRWFASPMACLTEIRRILNKENLTPQEIIDYRDVDAVQSAEEQTNQIRASLMMGQHDAYWLSYIDWQLEKRPQEVNAKEEELKNFSALNKIGQSCSCVFLFQKVAFLSERPIRIALNTQQQLHQDLAKAIEFSDGSGKYFLNGVEMPEKYVMTPDSQCDPQWVIAEANLEVRRELLRKVGLERCLNFFPHKILEQDEEYKLYSLDLSEELKECKYLYMRNPSLFAAGVEVWTLEGVHNDCKTIQDAMNFRRWGKSPEALKGLAWTPAQLT